jgi:hypothetical protein
MLAENAAILDACSKLAALIYPVKSSIIFYNNSNTLSNYPPATLNSNISTNWELYSF